MEGVEDMKVLVLSLIIADMGAMDMTFIIRVEVLLTSRAFKVMINVR